MFKSILAPYYCFSVKFGVSVKMGWGKWKGYCFNSETNINLIGRLFPRSPCWGNGRVCIQWFEKNKCFCQWVFLCLKVLLFLGGLNFYAQFYAQKIFQICLKYIFCFTNILYSTYLHCISDKTFFKKNCTRWYQRRHLWKC